MAFSRLMLTTDGRILYAKYGQGKAPHFTRVAIGDGVLGTGSLVNRKTLINERLSLPIDAILRINHNTDVAVIATLKNDLLKEGIYFREISVWAKDPDTNQDVMCLIDNAGADAEYIPDATSGVKISERLKLITTVENASNISFDPGGNPLYLTGDDIDDAQIATYSLWSSKKVYDELVKKADGSHTHDSRYYTELEMDTKLSGKERLIKDSATKDTPTDADSFAVVDSADTNKTKRVLWSRIKAVLKGWFDTLYAAINHTHDPVSVGGIPIVTTYTPAGGVDGVDYAADVPGVGELYKGLTFTAFVHVTKSTDNSMTMNVNGLGSKNVSRALSRGTARVRTCVGLSITGARPLVLMYHGSGWIITNYTTPSASDLDGTVPVTKGGTDLSTVAVGSYLTGNGTEAMIPRTPEQVAGDLDPYLPKGKRTCRFVVGTSTAGWTATDCDYLCDGTDDQVEINAAIQALPAGGGEVVILDGTYNITEKVVINKECTTLSGCGFGTVLTRKWAPSGYTDAVISAENSQHTTIKNLAVNGNRYESIASTGYPTGIFLQGCPMSQIVGTYCYDSYASVGANGYNIYLGSSPNSIVSGNVVARSWSNMMISASDSTSITGNVSIGGSIAIYASSSKNVSIVGNAIIGATGYSIQLHVSHGSSVSGNALKDVGTGLYISSSNDCSLCGNVMQDAREAILVAGGSRNNISSNVCVRGTGLASDYTTSQHTIRVAGTPCVNNLIANNLILGKNYTNEGSTGNTFTGNKYN